MDSCKNLACKEDIEPASILRCMGEFDPARLGLDAMEYTTLPTGVIEKLKKRFVTTAS